MAPLLAVQDRVADALPLDAVRFAGIAATETVAAGGLEVVVVVEVEVVPVEVEVVPAGGDVVPVEVEVVPAGGDVVPVEVEVVPAGGDVVPVEPDVVVPLVPVPEVDVVVPPPDPDDERGPPEVDAVVVVELPVSPVDPVATLDVVPDVDAVPSVAPPQPASSARQTATIMLRERPATERCLNIRLLQNAGA